MIPVIKTVREVREHVRAWRNEGLNVGLVPTMGFLHEGHRGLIERAVAENDRVVVSVFINPIQFAPNEDLESYPRDIEADRALCTDAGAAMIFNPEPAEMYPQGFCTAVDMNGLKFELCGKSRPIHFSGVCTVVTKLFNIVGPDRAYFGQKDAQQLAIIRRMVRDLNMPLEVVGCPIVHEEDGLAKSSRNTYLNEQERAAALILSKTIFLGQKLVDEGERDAKKLIAAMEANIATEPLARIDYVDVVDAENIERIDRLEGEVLVAMAVHIGKTRLIDNFIASVE